ncbi:Cardiolipin synthetase (EC [Lentimonas sp. CC19]|uniref:phospholipase D-like domain-containing protein n=1 Tax=Lentimonas sp. CC19 TaxID=2676097 RepID=UPI00132746E8|nr:phospholipase D family protein [Lentimonas sp. CC19]CAA6691879.1 Cardiolipin synthetase (EC [Lentimonas sp. CC19]CAA6694623.1 Cardiolipin synthetase (EC [Lentimonas sp. CC10]CAA7072140.1 Cardiolipin synthetase (EC [Lentimonas sp. CC11]
MLVDSLLHLVRASVAAVTLCWLAGCGTIQSIQLPDENAYAPAENAVWAAVGEVRAHDWGVVLNVGDEALEWRLRLIDSATKSIDLQTFLWYDDQVGLLLLRHLMDAADRGVRVRLLLDDTYTATHAEAIWDIDHHPNVEYRVYNPYRRRIHSMVLRQLMNLGDFGRLDHRMHNKIIIADNRASILGGRNLADEYFGWHDTANFRDLELLTVGPRVQKLSDLFDEYWNNDWSFPEAMVNHPPKGLRTPEEFARWLRVAAPRHLDESVSQQVAEWRDLAAEGLQFPYRVIADTPAPTRPELADELPNQLAQELVVAFDGAKEDMLIVTAYLIPTLELEAALERATARGVRVTILTNSIRSNNHLSAHSAYRKHIHRLLEMGVELYEVRTWAEDRDRYMQEPVDTKHLGLHAKFALIDDRISFVGSANLDPRSLRLNTEMSLLVDSPELNAELRDLLGVDFLLRNAWHLQLQPNGSVHWFGDDGIELKHQPADSNLQRLEDWFFSVLPEGQL